MSPSSLGSLMSSRTFLAGATKDAAVSLRVTGGTGTCHTSDFPFEPA